MQYTLRQIHLVSLGWMLLTTVVVLVPGISPWIATPVVLIGIILILGFLWTINLKIGSVVNLELLLYSLGLGLAFVMFGGLLINWLLPYWGIAHPLSALSLIVFFDLSAVALVVTSYRFNKGYILTCASPVFLPQNLWFALTPLAFVILSVTGAIRLNNGASGIVTLLMLIGIALYVIVLMLRKNALPNWVYASALYMISLSLLLMYSLRSNHIFGWDINLEYQVFQMTLQHLVWKASYYPGLDYNACISITILPTIFKELTHLSSEYIFKVTFQLLFAGVPVIIYALARRFLQPRLAFLAAFLLVSQRWFFEQMPALIRQEVAFIFFACLLLVLFDTTISQRSKQVLLYVFSGALVISHYSTAYLWVALSAGALIVLYGTKLVFKPTMPLVKESVITAMLPIVITSIALIFLWEVPLTHTAAQVQQFATNSSAIMVPSSKLLAQSAAMASSSSLTTAAVGAPAASSSSPTPSATQNFIQNGLITALFFPTNPNNQQNLLSAYNLVLYAHRPSVDHGVYDSQTTAGYVPHVIDDRVYLRSLLPSPVASLFSLMSQISKLLYIDIFPLVAIAALYFLYRHKTHDDRFRLAVIGLVAYALIVLIVFVPYLQIYYNLTRLYLQMFFILSILGVLGGMMVTRYFARYQIALLTCMAVILFCSLSGVFDQVGGGQARITLDPAPGSLDSFYTYDKEVAGAEWLAAHRNPSDPVQADILANLRLQSFGNMNADNFYIFPQTIKRGGYVYLSELNVLQGRAFYQYEGNILTYNYPLDFLNKNKSLIYNDGGSRVYQ